jgi:hypothetical protein
MASSKEGKQPAVRNEDVPEVVSEQTVAEFIKQAKTIVPLIGHGEIDPKVRGLLAMKYTLMPTVTTSMSRKVNTGDYENLDFFFSLSVPLGLTDEEAELHSQLCGAAIQQGIDIVNPEVNVRYDKVKKFVEERAKKKQGNP